MRVANVLFAVLSAALASQADAACYTVYVGNGTVYRSTTAPVDLSMPYSETLPARFGSGATMIAANDETGCSQVTLARGALPEGISRTTAKSRATRERAEAAPGKATSNTPVSLDGMFVDPSLQMRSAVGVSSPAPAPTAVQRR